MNWEQKATAWDLSNMGSEDDQVPGLATIVGSSSLISNNNNNGNRGGDDFSVDLQLGNNKGKGKGQKGTFNASIPSSSSNSKRARARASGAQNVTCMVDGCMADLSGCREYHRRHRVCERHSKTPVVSVAGKHQRFCQQCSRFQLVGEFDEEKRSCRKRLDGHNRRRRKPQLDAATAFYLNHHHHHHHSSLAGHHHHQVGAARSVMHFSNTIFPTNHCSNNNNNNKRFPFLLANEETERTNSHLQQLVSNNVNHRVHVHSLLSSSSPPRPARIQMPHQKAAFDSACPPQQSGLHRNTTSYYSGNHEEEVTVASLFPYDLLEKGSSQLLPFSWN